MKKQSIWVFEWRKSVHYWWSYILFSPECKELTSMLDPLLYRWGVPPVVIRCVHWTMQSGVLQTWIKALGLANVMFISIFLMKMCLFLSNQVKFVPTYPIDNTIIRRGSRPGGSPVHWRMCVSLALLVYSSAAGKFGRNFEYEWFWI